jgi:hypothetical protein
MPAETHTRREAIDAGDVLDLIDALVGGDSDGLRPGVSVGDVGLGDELAVLHLCDAVAEELAERTVAELDVEELLLASTVGELAEAIVRAFATSDGPDSSERP